MRSLALAALAMSGLAAGLTSEAAAHEPTRSHLELSAEHTGLDARWYLPLQDLHAVLVLDVDGDGAITWRELRARRDAVVAYARDHLEVRAGGEPCALGSMQLGAARRSDAGYAALSFSVTCGDAAPSALVVTYDALFALDPLHRAFVTLSQDGSAETVVVTDDARRRQLAVQPGTAWRAAGEFLRDGIWHIWIGADHILFLLALLLPSVLQRRSGRWLPEDSARRVVRDVTAVVSAFTVAHSLTLMLATFGLVRLPSRWVEVSIAVSIVLVALNNLVPVLAGRWPLAFGLGLLHGLGFSSVLMDLGLPARHVAAALLGFNLGVEVGQLAIVAVFLPLAFLVRASPLYRRAALVAGSVAVAVVGAWWAIERALS